MGRAFLVAGVTAGIVESFFIVRTPLTRQFCTYPTEMEGTPGCGDAPLEREHATAQERVLREIEVNVVFTHIFAET